MGLNQQKSYYNTHIRILYLRYYPLVNHFNPFAEIQPSSVNSGPSLEHEHGNSITTDKIQSKIHAQKRGGNELYNESLHWK